MKQNLVSHILRPSFMRTLSFEIRNRFTQKVASVTLIRALSRLMISLNNYILVRSIAFSFKSDFGWKMLQVSYVGCIELI